MRRQGTQRGASTMGLVIALLVALAGAGVVLYFAWSSAPGAGQSDDDPFGDVPSITDVLRQSESGGNVTLQYADRDDPSRLAAELKARSFKPAETDGLVEPSAYELTGVQARIFLDSGETVLVESERGRFYMPDREAGPESGHLAGHPKISLLPRADEGDEPIIVAAFDDELRFNFNYAHVETPGRLVVTGRQIEFAGTHVTARLNQQRERIDVLEVERGEYLTYTPAPSELDSRAETPHDRRGRAIGPTRSADTTTRNVSRGVSSHDIRRTHAQISRIGHFAAASEQPADPDPHIALYLATFHDGVQLTQGSRRLTADMLETWVRLVDHKLPKRTRSPGSAAAPSLLESIFAGVLAQAVDSASGAVDTPAEPVDRAPDASAPMSEGELREGVIVPDSVDSQPITLRWTGLLRVVPIVDRDPAPLAHDDVYLRFTAMETGLVRFEEPPSSGHAASVEYAATRELLTLTGPGGSVRLASEHAGWMESSRTIVRLASGEVTVVGPGQVYDADHDPAGPDRREKYVRWLDQADFAFELSEDGRMTSRIVQATFSGDARAVDADKRIDADMLVAHFDRDSTGSHGVFRFEAFSATAVDGAGGTLSAERLDVPFSSSPDGSRRPSHVYASGDVYVAKEGKSIETQSLAARIVRDARGGLTVTDVIADREVHYAEGQSIAAEAERLEANGLDQIAILIGSADQPARIDFHDSIIVGPRIEMQEHPQRGRVIGPGTFESTDDAGTTTARWSESLSFDRATGILEALGQAEVTQSLQTGETRFAAGDQLTIELEPSGENLTLDAASVFGTPDAPAVVELRRTDDEATLVEMINIESAELLTMDGGNALVAPRPGRLVVLNRDAGSDAELDGWDRGHALCTWHESLLVDRLHGRAYLRGDAQVIHRALETARTAEIAGDVIIAAFTELEGAQPEITRVDAEGTAYARVDQQEILCARLEFDTEQQLVYARGTDAEPARYFDAKSGSVISARSLTWNLSTDHIEIDRPSPFVTPDLP
ncbi:MAG: hypothetical protein D6695_07720 [Planctomycetota bacterium]|nr:MAG: hypothetical protein D6695_07720 [Planctomycetota bacterium]